MTIRDYHDQLAFELKYENFIIEKMEEQRQENIEVLGRVVRQDLAEQFAKILAAAYEFGCPEAENISLKFGFDQSDFLAIDENLEGYREHYEKNQLWEEYE